MNRPDFTKYPVTDDYNHDGYINCIETAEKIFDEWLEEQRRANIYIEGKGICDCIVIETGKTE